MDLPRSPRTRDPRSLSRAQASDADEVLPPPVTIDVPRPGEEARSRVRGKTGTRPPVSGGETIPRTRA